MPDAPCGYCEKKGCGTYHSQCKAYQDYKREIEKINEKKEQERKQSLSEDFYRKKDMYWKRKWKRSEIAPFRSPKK